MSRKIQEPPKMRPVTVRFRPTLALKLAPATMKRNWARHIKLRNHMARRGGPLYFLEKAANIEISALRGRVAELEARRQGLIERWIAKAEREAA